MRESGRCSARHGFAEPRGQAVLPGAQGGRFGRMFAFLPARDPGAHAIEKLADRAVKDSGPNDSVPAGYTYLGQFIDHDITFDPTSKLQRDNDPSALLNFRTPRFDLDSLYGSGPADQPFLYEWKDRADRGVKLLVGASTGAGEARTDLPRNRQGLALVGDARNDENLIVSQLHLLFIRFHNKVVDRVRDQNREMKPAEVLEEARRLVRWHYQWIVVHDFLRRILGEDLARRLIDEPAEGTTTEERRFYSDGTEPAIPVEFSAAAFRFGHTMIRDSYLVRHGRAVPILGDPDVSPGSLEGFRPLQTSLVIDWDLFFFDTETPPAGANHSLRLDYRLSSALQAVPPDGRSLPHLNLQRGRALGLPAGKDVARAMGETALTDEQLKIGVRGDDGKALSRATPLWFYILREASILGGGRHLGPVGGRIVAAVLMGLLDGDPHSYARQSPTWRPCLPRKDADCFTMLDLVAFTNGTTRKSAAGAHDA